MCLNKLMIFRMCGEEKVKVAHFVLLSVFLVGGEKNMDFIGIACSDTHYWSTALQVDVWFITGVIILLYI